MNAPLFRLSLQAALIPLVVGWLVALAFGALIARLEYTTVSSVFSPQQVAAEYQARVDHDMRSGPLLWLPQIGVVCGLLAWQIARIARAAQDRENMFWYGAIAGVLVAFVEGAIAWAMQVPMLLVVALIMLLIGAGMFAGWSTVHTPDTQQGSTIL